MGGRVATTAIISIRMRKRGRGMESSCKSMPVTVSARPHDRSRKRNQASQKYGGARDGDHQRPDAEAGETHGHLLGIPTARACSSAPCQASSSDKPEAWILFSPLVPVTTHTFSAALPTNAPSPIDQPDRCKASMMSARPDLSLPSSPPALEVGREVEVDPVRAGRRRRPGMTCSRVNDHDVRDVATDPRDLVAPNHGRGGVGGCTWRRSSGSG
jgi:hypothetical protein